MPALATKYSDTKFAKTTKRPKAAVSRSGADTDALDHVLEKWKQKLKKIFGSRAGQGPQTFDFRAVRVGQKIVIKRTHGIHTLPGSRQRTAKHKFDPMEAGRQVVAGMQQAEGGAWTGTELATKYGLTSANLHKRRTEYRIVWWKDARSQFHYPKWQFDVAGALLPGVQDVLRTFKSTDQWRVMRYFLAQRQQLDNRMPLDLLRSGDVERVTAHAKVHAEENTW